MFDGSIQNQLSDKALVEKLVSKQKASFSHSGSPMAIATCFSACFKQLNSKSFVEQNIYLRQILYWSHSTQDIDGMFASHSRIKEDHWSDLLAVTNGDLSQLQIFSFLL